MKTPAPVCKEVAAHAAAAAPPVPSPPLVSHEKFESESRYLFLCIACSLRLI